MEPGRETPRTGLGAGIGTASQQRMKVMKKIIAPALCALLFTASALAAEPTAADQKWLQAVEQKITAGDTQVSTPSAARVDLLKKWAEKNGYAVAVVKNDTGFRLDVSKDIARK